MSNAARRSAARSEPVPSAPTNNCHTPYEQVTATPVGGIAIVTQPHLLRKPFLVEQQRSNTPAAQTSQHQGLPICHQPLPPNPTLLSGQALTEAGLWPNAVEVSEDAPYLHISPPALQEMPI
jgi:hypothetical protein